MIELVTQFDQYRREVAFYNDFPDVGIATPRCLLARHEPAGQKMVLLLEHLAPSVSHSWALSPQQVAEAADHLPAFHARWWQNEDVRKKDWLVQTTDMDFWTAGAYGANSAAPVVREHFGTTADTTIEVMAFFLENINKVMASIARRPITLVHGDYHGKQMFFPSSEGGGFAVIDWQFPFAAQGAWDLARIMALGLDSEVRRENQDQLASDYYSGLVRCGVLDYTPDDLDYDLAMGTIASQMIMAIAIVGTDPALIQAECEHLGVDWKEVFILRGDRMLQDVGALDFLKAISNG